jgi:hypothetical protein
MVHKIHIAHDMHETPILEYSNICHSRIKCLHTKSYLYAFKMHIQHGQ